MAESTGLAINFPVLAKKYAGQWVALDPESGEVVAHGDTIRTVLEAALAAGVKEPVINHILDNYGAFAPWLQ